MSNFIGNSCKSLFRIIEVDLANKIIFLIENGTFQCLILTVCSEEMCLIQPQKDHVAEDEVMSKDDNDGSEEMMDDIASEMDIVEDAPSPSSTCANKAGMGACGKMGGLGALSGMAMPPMAGGLPPGVDPVAFSKILVNFLSALENRIQEAMKQNEQGICPQVKPLNIFLSKNPYLAYEEMLPQKDGFDAIGKINALRTDLKTYLSVSPH